MEFEKYIIRPPEVGDSPLLLEMVLRNRTRLIDYFPVSIGSVSDMYSTIAYIELKAKQANNKEAFTFILIDNELLKPIGMLFIKSIDWRLPKAELAYYIDREYEGKGITSKALWRIVEYAFSVLNINKLFLRIAPENIGSIRVAEKNGFVQEGVLRKDFKRQDGTIIDLLYYGLVRKQV